MKFSYVYILASIQRVLYIGVTADLGRRVSEHKSDLWPDSFTSQYRVHRLVHVEEYTDVRQAIAREKQLKGWRRGKKIRLIESNNPNWDDVS